MNIKEILENFSVGQNSSLKNKLETSYSSYWGKIIMLRKNYALSNQDFLRIYFNNISDEEFYAIDLHDRQFYCEGSKQFVDFKRVQVKLENGFKRIIWIKIEQTILLPEISNCNSDENYSFLQCSKVLLIQSMLRSTLNEILQTWISEQVGCRHPLDSISSNKIPTCILAKVLLNTCNYQSFSKFLRNCKCLIDTMRTLQLKM